jgi:hypothetical protein
VTARAPYVHEAQLALEAGADLAAPGGAVTAALCGAFVHPPQCPLAPHHTSTVLTGDGLAVRVLFAVEPAAEGEVRSRVDRALAAGFCDGPDGRRSRWTLRRSGPGVIAAGEREHASRLIGD